MLLKTFYVNESDGKEMYELYSEYIRMISVDIKGLPTEAISDILISRTDYNPSENGLLVSFGDGYLYTHIQFGITKGILAYQLSYAANDAGNKELFKDRLVKIKNNHVYGTGYLSADRELLIIDGYDSIVLKLDARQTLSLTLKNFIQLMFTGSLLVTEDMVHGESKDRFCIVNTTGAFEYIMADSGDICFDLDIDKYLKLFKVEQYKVDDVHVVHYVKNLCYNMLKPRTARAPHTSLNTCPMAASALLEICKQSAYVCFQYLGEQLHINQEVCSTSGLYAYMDLRSFLDKDPITHVDFMADFTACVLFSDDEWYAWERDFLSYLENRFFDLDHGDVGPVCQALEYKLSNPGADVRIIRVMSWLLYNAKFNMTYKQLDGLAMWLKKEFPDGSLCLVDNNYLVYKDKKGVIYAPITNIGKMVEYTPHDCDFTRELYELYNSTALAAPSDVLSLLSSDLEIDDWTESL